jgi:lipopolysaccharide biosynthesis regulator YciM
MYANRSKMIRYPRMWIFRDILVVIVVYPLAAWVVVWIAVGIVRFVTRHRSDGQSVRCPKCGYDVRATLHLCPECDAELRWGQLP